MNDNESLEGAQVVPEGFLEEEVRLRHLASAYLGATFEPQSQLWADFLSVLCLGGLFFILQNLAQPLFPLSIPHPACSQN